MNKRNFLIVLKWGAIMGGASAIVHYLREYTSTLDFYSFAPIMDVLMILVFVGCLYAGIKEYRNALQNQLIKFHSAFIAGGVITLFAVVFVFIYLLLNYSYFDKNAVDKINTKNEVAYLNKIKKDTISKNDIKIFLNSSFAIMDKQTACYLNSATLDSNCIFLVNNKINSLKYAFKQSLLAVNLADSSKYLSSFDEYSLHSFLTLSQQYTNIADSIQLPCISTVRSIFLNSAKEMEKVTPLQTKYQEGLSDVIHFTSVISAALFYTLPVLIYGLLFDLFVALFLFKKKKEMIVDEEEPSFEDNNQNIENK